MPRWMYLTLGILALSVSFFLPFKLVTQADSNVNVSVTMDGQPADALIRIFRNEDFFQVEYTDVHSVGEANFELPSGNYLLQVEHGAGFTSLPQQQEVVIGPGENNINIKIERVFNPNEQGYYSADLHTHSIASRASTLEIFGIPNHGSTPVDQAVGVQLAADLDVMFISDHNTVSSHALFAQTSIERGMPYLLSEEITTLLWGHFNAYSLEPGQLVEFGFGKVPSQFFEESRNNGAAMIQVNHPYSIGFGYFILEDEPMFRSDFEAAEVFNDHFGEDDLRTINKMFEFWNAGQRYVATAVSDDHDWKILGSEYGTPRTYAFVDGELTSEKFLQSIQAGHAYVTYGTLLDVSFNDAISGDTLTMTQGSSLTINAELQNVESLAGLTIDLIRNGQSVQSMMLDETTTQTVTFEETVTESGWYLIRVLKSPRDYEAMTNPIWIEVTL